MSKKRYEGVIFIVGADWKIADMIHMAHADPDIAISLGRPGYGTHMLAPLLPEFDAFCQKVRIGDVFDPEAIQEINFQFEELGELYT